jgi:hypothetical protein
MPVEVFRQIEIFQSKTNYLDGYASTKGHFYSTDIRPVGIFQYTSIQSVGICQENMTFGASPSGDWRIKFSSFKSRWQIPFW